VARLSLEDGMGGAAGQVACRTTEEEDMAYFEKRYQARVSKITFLYAMALCECEGMKIAS